MPALLVENRVKRISGGFYSRQTAFWLVGLATIILAVGFISNLVLSRAVEQAVHRGAISTSERWATYFAENIPQLDAALAGQVDAEQVAFVRAVEKMGDVFRFKLFDQNAKLVFVSDEVDKLLQGAPLSVEEEPHARNVLASGHSNVEVLDGSQKKNRPPLYAEAYVPVKDANLKTLGVAEVYVDQTLSEAQIRSSFYGLGLTLAGLVGIAVALPASVFMWRNQQAMRAIRKMADMEVAKLELEEVQSAELSAHNDQLVLLNRELAKRMKELGEAQDELVNKGRMEQFCQLTATVAHELRNPLGTVRTSAFLLDRKLKGKGLGVDEQVDRINKGIGRCDNIITQLLDFSRNRTLNCQPGDFDLWLEQVLQEESRKLPAAVSIHCSLGLGNVLVPFDPSRMQRAIVNLMTNASEAMVGLGDDPAKFATDEPTITIVTRPQNQGILLEVSDNGPGMTDDVLARIREPLFTTKSFGTGLGIPAIEQIAVQHGGRLDIQSALGKGSVFSVWLPLVAVTSETERAA